MTKPLRVLSSMLQYQCGQLLIVTIVTVVLVVVHQRIISSNVVAALAVQLCFDISSCIGDRSNIHMLALCCCVMSSPVLLWMV